MAIMLSSYRILDVSDERSNLTGLLLAQLGAEVIAIEPPQGNNSRHLGPFVDDVEDVEKSLTHWAWNRGKKSVVGGVEDAQVPKELEPHGNDRNRLENHKQLMRLCVFLNVSI